VRALARRASEEEWPYFVRALDSTNPLVLFDALDALGRLTTRPSPGAAPAYRALLLSARRLDSKGRAHAVAVLRRWTDKRFGSDETDPQAELASWGTWYAQTFPSATPLPDAAAHRGASKHDVEALRGYLADVPEGRSGDPARGRAVAEKAQCLKCHRIGKEGEGVGPDLTDVAKKFDRAYILESILSPSKVISDQYRSTTIATTRGQVLNGLVVPQGDRVVLILSDGTKATLEKSEIASQSASLVSVMPEGLLDSLSRREIADLFRYLEFGGTTRMETKR
jgi:putative heme-binding domain-containing protein